MRVDQSRKPQDLLEVSFPTTWAQAPFSALFEPISTDGKKIPQKQYKLCGRIPVVDQGSKLIGGFTDNANSQISSEKPLLVFGDHTRVFKCVNFTFAPGADGIKVLRPILIDTRYAYYMSRALPLRNKGYARHYQDLCKCIFPIAPSGEQLRIVDKLDELFSELDAGVASLKRARALLKKYRQAVLKAAVTGELTRDWRERHKGEIRESGAELLQRILKARRAAWEAAELKKLRAKGKPPNDDRWRQKYREPQPPDTTDLPDLPEGWVWISLDQLLTGIEAGKNFRCEERPPAEHEVGVVKVSSVTWGIFNEDESKTITDSRRVDRRYTIHPGDFLFSRANTIELVGACVIAGEFRKKLLLSDKILRLRLAHDLGQWVDICLKSKLGRSQIEALATGNQLSMRNISQPSIRRLTIPLPPLEEVEAAVDALEAEQSKAKEASVVIDQEVRRSSSLRQSILKAAFAGRLVPQDPNDEPASVLLERIRAERAAKPARGRRTVGRSNRREDQLHLAFDRGDTA